MKRILLPSLMFFLLSIHVSAQENSASNESNTTTTGDSLTVANEFQTTKSDADLTTGSTDNLSESSTVSKAETATPTNEAKKKDKKNLLYTKANHWSIAGHVGVGFIDGDQTQSYNALWPRSGADCTFGFEVEYTVNPGFGLYLEYIYNPYRGSTNYAFNGAKLPSGLQTSLQQPIDFEGLSHETNFGLSLNLLNLFYRYRPQKWNLYLNAGAGITFYDVNAYEPGTKTVIDKTVEGTHITPSIINGRSVTFPVGFTVEYNPIRWLGIVWNTQYRLHMKDNLDCTAKGNANDHTLYSGLGLRWKINNPKDKSINHVRNMSMADYERTQCCDETFVNSRKIADLETQIAALKSYAESLDAAQNDENLVDTDQDGIPDVRDAEPNTPVGSWVNQNGQSLDQAAIERILGYGQYKEDTPAIYFDLGSAKVSVQSHMVLAKIARKMYADPTLTLDIVGYCDNIGGKEVNNLLSIKRAEDAKRELVNRYGIPESRINTFGKGKTAGPIDGFMPNRRCDLILFNK